MLRKGICYERKQQSQETPMLIEMASVQNAIGRGAKKRGKSLLCPAGHSFTIVRSNRVIKEDAE